MLARSLPFRRLLPVIAASLGLFASACGGSPLPGTILGTYKVVGASQSNTCGAGLNAPDPYDFTVELSKDGETLYWSWMNGVPPLSGVNDATATTTTITLSQALNVDGTDAGAGPCTLERIDTLLVTLGTGAQPATFAGTLTYAFSAEAGAVCSDQLTSAGGVYAALPCAMAYGLSGTRQ